MTSIVSGNSQIGKEPCRSPSCDSSNPLLSSLPLELKHYEITQQERKDIATLRQKMGSLCTPRYTDIRLCRFLRARDGNIDQAEQMLRKEMQWRAQVNPELLMTEIKEHPAFQVLMDYWPVSVHGVDKYGVPIVFERFGAVDTSGLMTKTNQDILIKVHIYCMELNDALMSAAWEKIGAPIGYIHLEDFDGLGMKHYSNQGLAVMKDIAKIDECYYPETLRKFAVINAPGVFKFFWKLAKGVLNKNTIKKFEIVKKVDDTLLQGVISKDNLPIYLGGTCTSCPHVATQCKFGGGKAPKI